MAKVFRKLKAWLGMGYEDGDYDFPKSLEEFGYKFDEDGILKATDTNEPFEFRVKDDHHYNQKRYEALGEVVTDYIYDLMEKDMKLDRIIVPVDAEPEEPTSFIFVSKDALTSSKLLVLIHGSGAVRAGQWTRKLIINNNINIGSQLPYIRQGIKEGYGIIVLNTNLNTRKRKGGYETLIRGNESPERHGGYVFKNFVTKSKASCIAVVAHSYGGIVTQELVNEFPEFFKDMVFALAFTDSVHSFRRISNAHHGETLLFFKERGCNFAASYAPKNYPQNEGNDECPAVSAGTTKHEWTSHTSFDILFDFLSERLKDWVKKKGLANIPVDHEILYKADEGEEAVQSPTQYGNELESSQNRKEATDGDNVYPPRDATHTSIEQNDKTGGISLQDDDEKTHVYPKSQTKRVDSSNIPVESKNVETKREKFEEKTKSDTGSEIKYKKSSEVSSQNLEETRYKFKEKSNEGSLVVGEKTNESVVDGEKTKKGSVVDGEKTKEESVVESEKTKEESVVDGEKTKEGSVVDGEKTKEESVVDGEKKKEETVVDGQKTKEESVVDGEKTKERCVLDGERTKEGSVVDREKTKEGSVVDGEKTKEGSVVDGERTKKLELEDKTKTKELREESEKKLLDVMTTREAEADADRTSESLQSTPTADGAGKKDEL